MGPKDLLIGAVAALAAVALAAPPALADFPYAGPGADEDVYSDLFLTDQAPNDLCGDSNEFKYSASPDPANTANNARPTEVDGGVRGARVVDRNPPANCPDPPPPGPYTASGEPTAWKLTTGRPDVAIAVLDSGIKWDDVNAMYDLRFKTRINRGEVPRPRNDGLATPNEPGESCGGGTSYTGSGYDLNEDGVFNIRDYSCDGRVDPDPPLGVGPVFPSWAPHAGQPMLDPQDVLIAFSAASFAGDGKAGGRDDDGNGYVDDMVGWDFLDDDNDPYDDVQYGHGTGEAQGSSSEADNRIFKPGSSEDQKDDIGTNAGSCPNCMVVHMRVGDSFIADVNRFATAVTYATDNDVQVVQSALGTLNNSTLAREAVDYAYRHGTTVVLSAADEAAQHNNQPALPHTILVNSVTRSPIPPPDQSFTTFNGCTNFSAKITLSIPSTSCSSDAVGVGSGLAGLVYSAALNAIDTGKLTPHPDRDACETVDGDPCPITPNEVRQVLASGRVDMDGDGALEAGERQADDINFVSPSGGAEPSCVPSVPGCTGPYGALGLIRAAVNANRPSLLGPETESYPARAGTDQFYGWGRVDMRNAAEALLPGSGGSKVPPEAELRSPEWFEQVDPDSSGQPSIPIEGDVYARGAAYTCDVLVAPGQYPNQSESTDTPPGDFRSVGNGWCDGATLHSGADAAALHTGTLAQVGKATLKSYFPPATDFEGPEPEASPATGNGRPAQAPHSFTFKLVVSTAGVSPKVGEDQRSAYLHRDDRMLDGFPRTISEPDADGAPNFPTGDGESSPAFADLDGDNRNELIYASTDGLVHAIRPDGSEIPGWPARGDVPGFVSAHSGADGYRSGEVNPPLGGAFLGAVAIADADRNGLLEVYAADLEGKVYGFDHAGERIFTEESNPAFSGKPLQPFANVRQGKTNRTQHGFIASPVLADLGEDGQGDLELVAASMDRHLYAWDTKDSSPDSPGGAAAVDGYPVLVVDRDKVAPGGIDPQTHRIAFRSDSGSQQQGGMIDTPAIADLLGDAKPEIVVGTNEGYRGGSEPGPNTSVFSSPSFAAVAGTGLVEPGNTRLHGVQSSGEQDGDLANDSHELPGWPVALAFLNAELLPVVGEGVTGAPVIGPANCPSGGTGLKVGAVSYAGPGYVLNPDGSSCYGSSGGSYNTLSTDEGASSDAADRPIIPAVGQPAFGNLAGTPTPSFLMPAAGLQRALDLVLPDYQPLGQDYIAAWDTTTREFRPNFPQTQNDLSFLTGPSIADIDGLPGEEVVSGSASMDFNAYTSAGTAVAGWPKLSTDWVVANPLTGSFGTRDTDGGDKVVVGMTRSGYLMAWSTDAGACTPSSWPRFHHDNANSGDYGRDATLPGKPMDLAVADGQASFTAPGDDLLCGTADVYELATSDQPIDERNFRDATPLGGAPEPKQAGEGQSFGVPASARRYLAIRAVDDQGNVGRVATFDLGPGGSGPGLGGGGPSLGDGGPGSADGSGPGGGDPQGHCSAVRAGTDGRDTLRGDASSERIEAGGGGDKVKAGEGDDCVDAGGGRDQVAGEGGEDRIGGGKGGDRLRGNSGEDRITGGKQPDRIAGGDGDDLIRAAGDGRRDWIDCGGGDDTAIADAEDSVTPSCERVRERD